MHTWLLPISVRIERTSLFLKTYALPNTPVRLAPQCYNDVIPVLTFNYNVNTSYYDRPVGDIDGMIVGVWFHGPCDNSTVNHGAWDLGS